ncbi:putative copi associated protein [Botryosphaeria dothidea]|uniref:Copi associated protein n=1 Tax=Botryosphaeria dothidea TaxID=55169 RepID=A0A8H4N1H2_9PEZI|nr:putative copi associated protein [Botryosphaeria dothidea]
MDFSDIFRMVNLAVGVFMVLGGIAQFFPIGLKTKFVLLTCGFLWGIHRKEVIVGIYLILFGAATAGLEFQIPPPVAKYASFMFSFLGRGVFYVFIGTVILANRWVQYVPGTIIGIVGIAYIVLEFIPSIEPPANMRDADAGWGAEQV